MQKLIPGAATAALFAGSAFFAGAAFAADIAPVYKAPPAPAYVASPWDGLYVGGNIGFGETDFRETLDSSFGSATASANHSGVVGGVQSGYNRQYGNFVLGMESDFELTSTKGTTNGITTELPWFGTVRTRAGFLATPAFLIYGTGGAAYGRVNVNAPGVSIRVPGVGWVAGGGVQYAFGGPWSIGAEYLHVELDGPSADAGGFSIHTRATTDLGRATLNYKF
jgi:outer membrane immunogenic protein